MKAKPILAWGGFVEGQLDTFNPQYYLADAPWAIGESYFAIYKTRREARERYQDVRRVEIREAKP